MKKNMPTKLYLLTLKDEKKVATVRVAFASVHCSIIVLIKLIILQHVMLNIFHLF